jgi:hypothetical protein
VDVDRTPGVHPGRDDPNESEETHVPDFDETGAIDFVVIQFPRREVTGELVPWLIELVDRRLIRIMDVLIVRTADGGAFDTLTPDDLDPAEVGQLGPLVGASWGLLSTDDAAEIASMMEPNAGALALVYENLWSLPFARAARDSGGQLLSFGHIPSQAIAAALDELVS